MFNFRAARTLWHAKFHNLVHNSTSYVPILCHTNPIHAMPYYFFQIHFNIIVTSTSWFPKCIFSFRFPHQTSAYIFLLAYVKCPFHLKLLDVITLTIIAGGQYRSRNSLNAVFFFPASVTSCVSYLKDFVRTVQLSLDHI